MSIFLTGSTGYLGSYVVRELLDQSEDRLALLVRARDRTHAIEKLWRAWQLHLDDEGFQSALKRVDLVFGDLHAPDLGISEQRREELLDQIDSVLHIAATLNRKSEKSCLNTNLRGTLSVIKLAKAMKARGQLRRYSHVSTVAVAGHRDREVVTEDTIIDWERSDYDPYARTKKFCEHMARELLPDTPLTFFRPSIVMGDSTRVETSQFDMVRTFCHIADLPVIPLRPDLRLDIVNADWVGRAIATVHRKDTTQWDSYNLSSGTDSRTAVQIAHALVADAGRRRARFAPSLQSGFAQTVRGLNRLPRGNPVSHIASLLKVFLPYITYDTVFDNHRIVTELGEAPTPFTDYCGPLYTWAKQTHFTYPYQPLPPTHAEAA